MAIKFVGGYASEFALHAIVVITVGFVFAVVTGGRRFILYLTILAADFEKLVYLIKYDQSSSTLDITLMSVHIGIQSMLSK